MRHALSALLAVALTLGAVAAQERSSPAAGKRNDAKRNDGKGATTDKRAKNTRPAPKRRPRNLQVALPAFTPAAEKAALRFVRQHLKPLVTVLERLSAEDPAGYQRAIRQLFSNSEKISGYRRRDRERYEVELELWKIDNRIRMLAVDITMDGASDSRKEELRKLFLQKNDWQVKRYELDRKRTAARLERLDATIAKLKKNREQLAERAAEQQLRAGTAKRPRRPRPKTADVKAGGPATDKPTTPRTGKR